ncbi:hypothetical protein [Qipengyuania huizhouensis]|uniref:hypothetical protein n=1 Tax=Qipengyuania huizhouensis TaxID=2867245 RepID=UPI001C886F3C|nr:hypothetical protein [Qipengyuania huizhouensis]MBX7460308.1 hypothetical protein [Qipengyuania huizhouensis]
MAEMGAQSRHSFDPSNSARLLHGTTHWCFCLVMTDERLLPQRLMQFGASDGGSGIVPLRLSEN